MSSTQGPSLELWQPSKLWQLSPHPLDGDNHHRNPSCPLLFQEREGVRCADKDLCVTICNIVQYPMLPADCCCGFSRCASEHWPCLITYQLVSARRGGDGGGGDGGRFFDTNCPSLSLVGRQSLGTRFLTLTSEQIFHMVVCLRSQPSWREHSPADPDILPAHKTREGVTLLSGYEVPDHTWCRHRSSSNFTGDLNSFGLMHRT